jgi:hypothetical protein
MAINANARDWLRNLAETGDVLGALGVGEPWLRARLIARDRAAIGSAVVVRWNAPANRMPVEFYNGVDWQRVNAAGQMQIIMPGNDLTLRLRVGPRVACNHVVRLIRTPAVLGVEPTLKLVPIGGTAEFRVFAADSVETLFREEGEPWQPIPNEAIVSLHDVICERRAQVSARGTDGRVELVQLRAIPEGFPNDFSNAIDNFRRLW